MPRTHRSVRGLRHHGLLAASIAGGLVAWQLAVSIFRPNPLAVVGPWDVARDTVSLLAAGTLWPDIRLSLVQLFVGLGSAIVIGAAAGLVLGASPRALALAGPWLTALYTIPVIAVAPLIIVAFGIGGGAKVLVVTIAAFFPIAINTIAGAREMRGGELRDVARAFGAGRWETLRDLIAPGAVPHLLTGIRLGIGRGLVGLVAADLFGSTAGIGYLILAGQQNLRTADVYVGVAALAVIGLALTGAVGLIERAVHSARSGGRLA